MSATNFNTKNATFRSLLGNGLSYQIPPFQRDYSWSEDEWDDLWQDILGCIKPGGEPAHYMGYLVLQSNDDKNYAVIDGQQRLTTISLIILAAMRNLQKLIDSNTDKGRSQQRLDQLRSTYIGYLDPVTLTTRSKLVLNRNNDQYYQNYIVPLRSLPSRGFKVSEHRLRKASEWFTKRVHEHAHATSTDTGHALAELVEALSDKLFFTVISVTDELNAYKVFETLNARGVRLSATDLLKNYLFSVVHSGDLHEHELQQLEDRWEQLVGRLGSEDFPSFLRAHWNGRHSFVRQTELFKTLRQAVRSREQAFALLRDMEEDLDTYLALSNPSEARDWPLDWRDDAGKLKMFSVRQPFAMLLTARRALPDSDFGRLLHGVLVSCFRYNVIGSAATGEQERAFSRLAEGMQSGQIASARAALDGLRPVYPSDDHFRTAFTDKAIRTTSSRNKRIVRYIICEMEKHCFNKEWELDATTWGIEHILPRNPGDEWGRFDDAAAESHLYRLGNMTPMSTGANRHGGNESYPAKGDLYKQSPFGLTRRIAAEYADWTPETLASHQQWMARQATSIWRIDGM